MIRVQTTSPMEIVCRRCRGVGFLGHRRNAPQWCPDCGGPGAEFLDLACLGFNLSIAGALAEATRRASQVCASCGLLPCDGNHWGTLPVPCCECCPVGRQA